MSTHIRPFEKSDIDAIVEFSLLAWEPVFVAWERILGPTLYPLAIYPDWRKSQKKVVERGCSNENLITWVAEVDENVAGFVAYELRGKRGVVELLAVHPEHQNRGIGTELNNFAIERMREAGMKIAEVGTGGDEGHAPARRSYEKAGYTALPLVRYYKKL